MFEQLWQLLGLRCSHRHITFPQRERDKKHAPSYVVCHDCHKRFEYDWSQMKITGPAQPVAVGKTWQEIEQL
jgi:hypothetical protein